MRHAGDKGCGEDFVAAQICGFGVFVVWNIVDISIYEIETVDDFMNIDFIIHGCFKLQNIVGMLRERQFVEMLLERFCDKFAVGREPQCADAPVKIK